MYRKAVRLVMFLSLIALVLAGCSGGAGTQEPPAGKSGGSAGKSDSGNSGEKVELRYMIWDQNQEPAYRQALDLFMEQNPNIKVTIEVVPWGDYWTKLKTQAAGEVMPDLFWTYIGPIPDLAEKNLLYDLTPLTDQVDMSKYNETLVKNLQYKGKTYGLPKDWDALALFYNKDLLREAGFDDFPADLEWNPRDGGTFVQFLQKLTIDKNGKKAGEEGFDPNNIVQYGFYPNSLDPQGFSTFIVGNGGAIQDQDGKLILDEPKAAEAMKFVNDLVFKYHVMPRQSEITAMPADAMFMAQRIAVWMTGPWMMKPINESAPFEWGTALNPKGPAGQVTRINGLTDSIYANTPHPKEAMEVAKFLASKAAQDILGDTGTVFPAYTDSIQKFVDFYSKQGMDASVFVEALNGITVGDPTSPKWDQVIDVWKKNISLAFDGEMPIEDAINNIVKDGNVAQGF